MRPCIRAVAGGIFEQSVTHQRRRFKGGALWHGLYKGGVQWIVITQTDETQTDETRTDETRTDKTRTDETRVLSWVQNG